MFLKWKPNNCWHSKWNEKWSLSWNLKFLFISFEKYSNSLAMTFKCWHSEIWMRKVFSLFILGSVDFWLSHNSFVQSHFSLHLEVKYLRLFSHASIGTTTCLQYSLWGLLVVFNCGRTSHVILKLRHNIRWCVSFCDFDHDKSKIIITRIQSNNFEAQN